MKTPAVCRDDQGRQRETDQKRPQQGSRQTKRVAVQPYDGDSTKQLAKTAGGQPGEDRGLDEEDGQDHPCPPATASEHAGSEESNGYRHTRRPVDDQRPDPGTPACQGSATLAGQAEPLAGISFAGRGRIRCLVRHVAEATCRNAVRCPPPAAAVLHARNICATGQKSHLY
jgi:hypothetical protein